MVCPAIARIQIQRSTDLKGVYSIKRVEGFSVTPIFTVATRVDRRSTCEFYANFGPRKVPQNFSDEEVLFLTDIFPTGYSGINWAGVKGGETVAVFGCGPVGLMAQKCAWMRGAARVIGVDILDYRLSAAKRTANSETINAERDDPVQAIRDMTEGRGADVCVDAVGVEAERKLKDKLANIWHVEVGSIKALKAAISAVRRGGWISVLGVYGGPYDK